MSAKVAKDRLHWIVQHDRIRCMGDNLRRPFMVWWVPTGFHF